jgi:PHD/YefM family antitoxin component YafN of YafNO toxin-antitoxin module
MKLRHEIIRIPRHGRAAAVLISADDLGSLHETLHALRKRGVPAERDDADRAYAANASVSW